MPENKTPEIRLEETLGLVSDASWASLKLLESIEPTRPLRPKTNAGSAARLFFEKLEALSEGFKEEYAQARAQDFAESLECEGLLSAAPAQVFGNTKWETVVRVFRKSDEEDRDFPAVEESRVAIYAWVKEPYDPSKHEGRSPAHICDNGCVGKEP